MKKLAVSAVLCLTLVVSLAGAARAQSVIYVDANGTPCCVHSER